MAIKTKNGQNKIVGIIRIMLGIIFIMTGVMKLTMADYGAAWSIQLIEAEIPFYTFNYWFVPIFETAIGTILVMGLYSRLSAILILPIMAVAIYVHLNVTNPEAFPSQPQEPYMPILVVFMALVVIVKGSGNWSIDIINSSRDN